MRRPRPRTKTRPATPTCKIIHAVVATAANVADSTVLGDLLHGEETRVWGERPREVIKQHAPKAKDFTNN